MRLVLTTLILPIMEQGYDNLIDLRVEANVPVIHLMDMKSYFLQYNTAFRPYPNPRDLFYLSKENDKLYTEFVIAKLDELDSEDGIMFAYPSYNLVETLLKRKKTFELIHYERVLDGARGDWLSFIEQFHPTDGLHFLYSDLRDEMIDAIRTERCTLWGTNASLTPAWLFALFTGTVLKQGVARLGYIEWVENLVKKLGIADELSTTYSVTLGSIFAVADLAYHKGMSVSSAKKLFSDSLYHFLPFLEYGVVSAEHTNTPFKFIRVETQKDIETREKLNNIAEELYKVTSSIYKYEYPSEDIKKRRGDVVCYNNFYGQRRFK